MSALRTFQVELAFATPDKQQVISLPVVEGTRARELVLDALARQLIDLGGYETRPESLPLGIYGETVSDEYVLHAGDRLEIYRPLKQDPMQRRRQKAKG